MKTYIQILTHKTSDTPGPCLLLQAGPAVRYIIGQSGEGLQRSIHQNKIRMNGRLSNVFLTGRINWNSIGGMPGLLLTLADQGIKAMTLHGPKNLSQIVNTWRHFFFRQSMQLNFAEQSQARYQDQFVVIETVRVGGRSDGSPAAGATLSVRIGDATKKDHGPLVDPSSTCYIVQILPSRGKFQVDKALALGVSKGPDFRILSEGGSVTTASGRVVLSEEVMDKPSVPPRVLVIDCPDSSYIEEIVSYPSWNAKLKLENGGKRKSDGQACEKEQDFDHKLSAVYHFLGRDVDFLSAEYQAFLARDEFKDCIHYISHPDYAENCIVLSAAEGMNEELKKFWPENFASYYRKKATKRFEGASNVKQLTALSVLELEPKVEEHSSIEKVLDKEVVPSGLDYADPFVITVGTGSAMPSKYRNVLCSIVSDGTETAILDCGEGSVGSMRRMLGDDGLTKLLATTTLLYISHMHADHHLGLISLISEWQAANDNDKVITLMCPVEMKRFLNDWKAVDPSFSLARIRILDLEDFLVNGRRRSRSGNTSPSASPPRRQPVPALENGYRVLSCRAIHCDHAYSSKVTFPSGFSVAFSGDTRPNPHFARKVGLGCDLLIHESTHDNDLAEEAEKKKHSTMGEALETARQMEARAVVLTHFSQRYPKIPQYAELENSNAALAFDGMRMRVKDIYKQKERLGAVGDLFREP